MSQPREEYYLAVFESMNQAVAAQRLLRGLEPVVMPTLREISASCGMSLRIPADRAAAAMRLLCDSPVENWRLYRILQQGRQISCQLMEALV